MSALRISDADRQAAVELLSDQYAVGRLTKDELDERSDAAWAARTEGELAPVFADLPVRSPAQAPVQSPSGALARATGHPWRRWPSPLPSILVVLIVMMVVTHLPLVLVGLLVWFVVLRGRGPRRWHQRDTRSW